MQAIKYEAWSVLRINTSAYREWLNMQPQTLNEQMR